jgi:hypothetical protein
MPLGVSVRGGFAALVLASCVACSGDSLPPLPASGITMLESPSGDGARFPFLAADSAGRVVLSWIERGTDSVPAIRFSVREPGGSWRAAETFVRDTSVLVNFADFPFVVPIDDGRLVGQWLRHGISAHAYDLLLAQSVNGGDIWSASTSPHARTRPGEHGFVSMYSMAGGAAVQFLDGSHAPRDSQRMMLRHAVFDSTARVASTVTIDDRVCECCQTDAAVTAQGPVVVYRDRSPDEVRDIAIARRSADGAWSTSIVHADGWRIEGCPVNGPAVAADGARVAVAGFTAAGDTTRVRLAFSSDAGASFGAPLDLVAGPAALGRVDVAWLPDGRALVAWLARASRTDAHVQLAAVSPDHAITWNAVVGRTDGARASGFPRMVRAGAEVLVAWTETGTPTRVRLASVTAR